SAQIGWYRDLPDPETGSAGSHETRPSSVSQGSPGEYMIEGAKTVVSSDDASTALCASALARKKRVREWRLAPMVEKKANRRPPRPLAPKATVIARLASPADVITARAPGRRKAGERAHTASVAISVPRSHARAHQSFRWPRLAASAWAAAKVSQIGPQRLKRWVASSDGRS